MHVVLSGFARQGIRIVYNLETMFAHGITSRSVRCRAKSSVAAVSTRVFIEPILIPRMFPSQSSFVSDTSIEKQQGSRSRAAIFDGYRLHSILEYEHSYIGDKV